MERLMRARRVAAVAVRSGARFWRARARCPRRIAKAAALKAADPDALALVRDAEHARSQAGQHLQRIALDDVFHAAFETVFHSKLFPAAVAKVACGGLEAFGVAAAVCKAGLAAAVALSLSLQPP